MTDGLTQYEQVGPLRLPVLPVGTPVVVNGALGDSVGTIAHAFHDGIYSVRLRNDHYRTARRGLLRVLSSVDVIEDYLNGDD